MNKGAECPPAFSDGTKVPGMGLKAQVFKKESLGMGWKFDQSIASGRQEE